jgi:hypothetical protein
MWTSEGNTQTLIPVRELAAWIESNILLQLASAPFDKQDETSCQRQGRASTARSVHLRFFRPVPAPHGVCKVQLYMPKGSAQAQLLEGKSNHLHLRQEIPLSEEEMAVRAPRVAQPQHAGCNPDYAKITPTKLAKSYADAGYFKRNLRAIEVLVGQEVVCSGRAVHESWKFYDLGHGY